MQQESIRKKQRWSFSTPYFLLTSCVWLLTQYILLTTIDTLADLYEDLELPRLSQVVINTGQSINGVFNHFGTILGGIFFLVPALLIIVGLAIITHKLKPLRLLLIIAFVLIFILEVFAAISPLYQMLDSITAM